MPESTDQCPHSHIVETTEETVKVIKLQLIEADRKRAKADEKRDIMESTLSKIEGHLAVGNERFKWLERAGWGLGIVVIILIGYMITMSITSHNRDAAQNMQLLSIEKDVGYIVKTLKGE